MKIALLAVFAFAAPLAITVAYQLDSEKSAANNDDQSLIGKVLFFSSPG